MNNGVYFSVLGSDTFLHFVELNDAGQTAFIGILAGTGIDSSNDRGIWAENTSGVLKLIAREGDLLDVNDGPGTDFRTIERLAYIYDTGNRIGPRSGFNNLGQLAFRAKFTDGSSGIFVSNVAAIPEPSTLLLTLLGLASACCWRRRQS